MKIPILILTHTRLTHLKKCIESLLACPESFETELFISSDNHRDEKEETLVSNIREYINKIKGFKKVTPIFFEKNVGSREAFLFCMKKIYNENNNNVIISEDDNTFSPLFLEYMNTMSDNYFNNDKVFGISGFSTNILQPTYEFKNDFLYKSQACAVWGFILNKDKYLSFMKFINDNNFYEILTKDLQNRSFVKKLNKISLAYYPHFLNCIRTKESPAFDHLIAYYCLKKEYVNIHNSNTYVKNMGHDGSGARSEKNVNLQKHIQNLQFSKTIPEVKSVELIPERNDLFGYNDKSLLKYYTKLILIRLGIFNNFKGFIKKMIYG